MVKINRPQKVKRKNVSTEDHNARKARMLEYLQKHPTINISDYAELNKCTYYMAQNDIQQFVTDKIISSTGYRTHRVYMLIEAVD